MLGHKRMVLLTVLVLGVLALPVASVNAKKNPFVTATHTGGTGGSDGDVIFEIINIVDTNGITRLQVTETDVNQNSLGAISATPSNWKNTGILVNGQGKGYQTTWVTCGTGQACASVVSGTSLEGFDVRMKGNTPYSFTWIVSDPAGNTFTGSLSVS